MFTQRSQCALVWPLPNDGWGRRQHAVVSFGKRLQAIQGNISKHQNGIAGEVPATIERRDILKDPAADLLHPSDRRNPVSVVGDQNGLHIVRELEHAGVEQPC
jgi:hypothetical protein